MKACVGAAATAAGKTMKTATRTEKEGWIATCKADAAADFEASGGKPEHWPVAQEEGATASGGEKLMVCIAAAAEGSGKAAKDVAGAELLAWKASCEADAQAEFEAAGGDGEVFETALVETQIIAIAETLAACKESAAGASADTAACE